MEQVTLKGLFNEIVDAIHEKDLKTDGISAIDFPARIRSIPTGGLDGVNLESIDIVSPPEKTAYFVGQTFSPDGICVEAKFSNGFKIMVSAEELTFDAPDLLTEETTSVTVNFQWGLKMASARQEIKVLGIGAIYGVRIAKAVEDPYERIEYTDSAEGFTPAHMNYESDQFEWGDWSGTLAAELFYPCMLNFDGTEAYRLDPNNYAMKEDGTPSDVKNLNFAGNAMACCSRKVWLKQWEDSDYEYIQISFSEFPDSNCDAFNSIEGLVDQIYYPMFKGTVYQSKLRSIARTTPSGMSLADGLSAAKSCGERWTTYDWSSVNLLRCLLIILGKSDNSQAVFGRGRIQPGNNSMATSGTDLTKGAFYGTDSAKDSFVRTFHIENFWSQRNDFAAGLLIRYGRPNVKTAPPYPLSITEEYTDAGAVMPVSGTGWIAQTTMTRYGRFPRTLGGGANQFACDYAYTGNSALTVGCFSNIDGQWQAAPASHYTSGVNDLRYMDGVSTGYWNTGCSPMYK